MAIGKLLPRAFTATPALRIGRPDIRCRKAWPPLRIRLISPTRLQVVRGLVTPPLPFAEAERKASLDRFSIIRFPADCLRQESDFSLAEAAQGLGVSSLNRPAPPWPSGF